MLLGQRTKCACSQWSAVWSNGHKPFCSAVKRSNSKNDGQNFLTPVLAINTVRMGGTTPWSNGALSIGCDLLKL